MQSTWTGSSSWWKGSSQLQWATAGNHTLVIAKGLVVTSHTGVCHTSNSSYPLETDVTVKERERQRERETMNVTMHTHTHNKRVNTRFITVCAVCVCTEDPGLAWAFPGQCAIHTHTHTHTCTHTQCLYIISVLFYYSLRHCVEGLLFSVCLSFCLSVFYPLPVATPHFPSSSISQHYRFAMCSFLGNLVNVKKQGLAFVSKWTVCMCVCVCVCVCVSMCATMSFRYCECVCVCVCVCVFSWPALSSHYLYKARALTARLKVNFTQTFHSVIILTHFIPPPSQCKCQLFWAPSAVFTLIMRATHP